MSEMTFALHAEPGNICLSCTFVAARCGVVMVSALGPSPYPYLVFLRCVFVMIWIKIKWAWCLKGTNKSTLGYSLVLLMYLDAFDLGLLILIRTIQKKREDTQ